MTLHTNFHNFKTLPESESNDEQAYFEWGRQHLYATLLQREEQGYYPKEKFQLIGQNGFFYTGYPDEAKATSPGSIFREIQALKGLAKGSLDIPFCLSMMVHSGMGLKILNTFGSSKQKSLWLKSGLEGRSMFGIANTENAGGTDLKSICSSLIPHQDRPDYGVLKVSKKIASNVGDSELIFASVWKKPERSKPRLEIILLDKNLVTQKALDHHLSGFACGKTGSLSTMGPKDIHIPSYQLGPDGSGGHILRTMFNLDRLYMTAIVSGILEGTLQLAFEFINKRQSMGHSLRDYQYIQEKIIRIYTAKNNLDGILSQILCEGGQVQVQDLEQYSDQLCVAKIHSMDQGLEACVAFYEIFGARAYEKKHPAGKLIRDILAFKFLGGSKEQQKMILFQSLSKHFTSSPEKR